MYDMETIKSFIYTVIVESIQPDKVILFGSYAYGQPRDKSDVDLLIIKNTDENEDELFIKLGKKRRDSNIKLMCDIIIMNDEDIKYKIKGKYGAVYDAIVKGVVMYERVIE